MRAVAQECNFFTFLCCPSDKTGSTFYAKELLTLKYAHKQILDGMNKLISLEKIFIFLKYTHIF